MKNNKNYFFKNKCILKLLINEENKENKENLNKINYKENKINKDISIKSINKQKSNDIVKRSLKISDNNIFVKKINDYKKLNDNYKEIIDELKKQNLFYKKENDNLDNYIKNIFLNILSIYYNISKNNLSLKFIFNDINDYLKENIETLKNFNLLEQYENIKFENNINESKIKLKKELNKNFSKFTFGDSLNEKFLIYNSINLNNNIENNNNLDEMKKLSKKNENYKTNCTFENKILIRSNQKNSNTINIFNSSSSLKNSAIKKNLSLSSLCSSEKKKNNKTNFIVLCDFNSVQKNDLSIKAADILELISKNSDGWYKCKNVETNLEGFVPSNYLKELI